MKRSLIYCYVHIVLCCDAWMERRLQRHRMRRKARRLRHLGRVLGMTEEETIRACYELDMRQRGMR